MSFEVGRKFWIAATAVIVVVTLFVVGRNSLHAVKIKRQINAMTREKEYYRTKSRTARCWSGCSTTIIWRNTPARITTCSGGANTSILSRNKSYAGRRLPESVKCGGLRAAVFCYGCRRRKCLPRVEMPAERRYVGRCEGRPVCSAAVFFVMACRGTKCLPRDEMPAER